MAIDKKDLREVYITLLEEDIIKEITTNKGIDKPCTTGIAELPE